MRLGSVEARSSSVPVVWQLCYVDSHGCEYKDDEYDQGDSILATNGGKMTYDAS